MGRRAGALAAGILLLLGVAAAAVAVPTLLLRADDNALLNSPHAYPAATGTLALPPEELYPVVGALYAREDVSADPGAEDFTSIQSQDELDELLPRMWKYSEQLVSARVLPEALFYYIEETVFAWEDLNFSRYIESAGIEVITANGGGASADGVFNHLTYHVDMSTDLVVGIHIQLGVDAPFTLGENRAMAQAWLAYLGLDMAGDWRFFGEEAEGHEAIMETGFDATARAISDSLRAECYVVWEVNGDTMWGGASTLDYTLNTYHANSDEWWNSFNILINEERGDSG